MSNKLYTTPFSAEYWREAVGELKKPRMLVFAALMIALRVALKGIVIPVGPYLNINFGYFINALGAMTFGPVMAILAAAISDTLGCLLFPSGAYFFPFIFVEIAGSLTFSLFLYRTKLSTWRVIFSRFSVTLICNLILNPAILIWFQRVVNGKDYAFFTVPRMIKNLCLFPVESFLLVLFLNLMVPITNRMDFTFVPHQEMKFSTKHVVSLVVMAVVSVAAVAFYGYYKVNLK